MATTFKHLSLITASLLFIGCGGGGGISSEGNVNNSSPIPISNITKKITIDKDIQIEDLGKASNVKATVNVGNTPKSVYILLSNESETAVSSPTVTHSKTAQTLKYKKESPLQISTIHAKRAIHAPAHIQAFNKSVKKPASDIESTLLIKKRIASVSIRKKDVAGDSYQTFYTDIDTSKSTQATARKVVSNISTAFGNKTLNIWVSDDSFDSGSGCDKTKCVTQAMVDALADTFLKSGLNNDIYDWVSHIYGQEWGSNASDKYANLIGANNEITILLTDIDNDNEPNGGVIGYFHSKDNYNKYSNSVSSNERVMFYIDAVMFANGDAGSPWSIEHAWPKEVVATLAHEFVHMIEFYQKTVLLNVGSETWLAEMLAESTEDMVATKIAHKGPRGVDPLDGSAGNANNEEGRYGLFNENNTLSLTTWTGALSDYSKVNAFGAFLIRNYGGAKLLHDMMHNAYEDEQAVVDAVNKPEEIEGKTFATLQKEWGIALLLSDKDNLAEDTPTYNRGDFTVSQMGDVVYKMGSINFFNYIPQPSFSKCTTVKPQANCYYKVGDNLTGEIDINLTLNTATSATLIVK